jgi:hypothetical protein
VLKLTGEAATVEQKKQSWADPKCWMSVTASLEAAVRLSPVAHSCQFGVKTTCTDRDVTFNRP